MSALYYENRTKHIRTLCCHNTR